MSLAMQHYSPRPARLLPAARGHMGADLKRRRHPDRSLSSSCVAADHPPLRAQEGTGPARFAHAVEREYARLLDYHGVRWKYEPRTFVLERDVDGRVTEAMTPDFYLPDEDLYVEVTVMRQQLVTRKNRKLRKLRERYPEIRVIMLYRRDLERLGARHGFSVPAA
jgi:hypothetical protein